MYINKSEHSKHNFYEQIYNGYKTQIFDSQEKYYDWYRQADNLLEAIEKAFKSEDERNKVHGHQCNVGRKVLKQATKKAVETYQENNLSEKDLNTFEKIYEFVDYSTVINRFGELAHYDVSLRIAKYQELKYPICGHLTEVYLHRGTLNGAKAVFYAGDMDKSIQKSNLKEGRKISITSFPHPLNTLSGDHLENLLCIYKQQLKEQKISGKQLKSCVKPEQKGKVKGCT